MAKEAIILRSPLGALACLALVTSCSERQAANQEVGGLIVVSADDDEEDESEKESESEKSAEPDGSSSGGGEPSPESSQEDSSQSPKEPEPEPGPGGRALVIKHGWDVPNARALARIEQEVRDSAFDGVVFSAGKASRIFGSEELTEEDIRRGLRGLEKVDPNTKAHYYLIVYVDAIPGGFSGEGARILARNAELLGKVASEYPIRGIAFDNEVYKQNPWDMPEACPGKNRKECGEVAFAAGRAMMQGLMKHWPDLHFWAFFGPWLNDPRTYTWINKYARQNDWSEDDDVACEFLTGVFAASTQGPALFVDGGELYGLRTQSDFAKTAQWNRDVMVKESPFFPTDDLRKKYSEQMKVGFGIYDDRLHLFKKIPQLNEGRWSKVIEAATKEADLVWVYTERHDWWRNDGNDWPDTSKEGTLGRVSPSWTQAAHAAIQGEPRLLVP